MPNRCYIRPIGSEWRVVPSAIEAVAEIDLPGADTEEEWDRQWADYAARLMGITGPYDVEFRREEGGDVTVLAAFSATVTRSPGDPITEIPMSGGGTLGMAAFYINPDVKQDPSQ